MKRFVFIILSILIHSFLTFGKGYKIELKLDAAAEKKIYLAYHYLGNVLIKDSLQLDVSGNGILYGDSLLPQGLYKIYLDDKNHFDFLLGADQEFSLSNPSFSSSGIQIDGSLESEEFLNYMLFLRDLQIKGTENREKLKTAKAEEKQKLQTENANLTTELHDYQLKVNKKYPNSFLAKFLICNYVPTLDISSLPMEIQQSDSLLLIARFNYQKQHFWDNFDYTDERFLYTPFYKTKLETWFNKVLVQNYDSVRPAVFEFIENTESNKRVFQFVVSWFLNSNINSKIMGMDALFVDLAKKYYLSGKAFWAGEESMGKIRENVQFLENNLIGNIAPDLTLESYDGEYFNLHQIEKKRTIVLIYEPDCSHCKVFVPEFYDKVYQKFKDKGLEVFAIYSMDDKEKWGNFLIEHKLFDWINVWDKDHVSLFKILYDTRKTPRVFVLDENKKIIFKNLDIDQLEKLMEYELK